MKYLLFVFFALTALAIGPVSHAAENIYSHIVSHSGLSSGTLTGAPDGDVAFFLSDASWVEFGFPQEHEGTAFIAVDLNGHVTGSSLDYSFMDGATVVHSGIITFSSTEDTITVLLQNPSEAVYDRVRLFANERLVGVDAAWIEVTESDKGSSSDAEETEIVPIEPVPEDTDSEDTSETSEPQLLAAPDLFKIYDDGDPETQHDSAVYAIDPNTGMRRPFFNQTIFDTWYTGFDDVIEISAEAMAAIPLGPPMPVHHGTWLVKIQSANDVFAVEAGGVLRKIETEAIASALWGANWNQRVIDIPVTEFPRYAMGEPVDVVVYPDDTLARDASNTVWHIRNGVKRQVTRIVQEVWDIQDIFILSQPPAFEPSLYTTGATYSVGEDFGWHDLD